MPYRRPEGCYVHFIIDLNNMTRLKCEAFADMMLNTPVICLLKWLSDKFLTISLNISANPCGQLPTVSTNPKSALPRRLAGGTN